MTTWRSLGLDGAKAKPDRAKGLRHKWKVSSWVFIHAGAEFLAVQSMVVNCRDELGLKGRVGPCSYTMGHADQMSCLPG
jgi:hypothetical protein